MMTRPSRRSVTTAILVATGVVMAACSLGVLPAVAQELTAPAELKNLKYRSIGPAAGGRICRVCGIPADPETYYAATASGGVWKSTDGGINWKPTFDDQPV